MKSVGEVMAIGRTFKEALLKGVRSLETGKKLETEKIEPRILTKRLVSPHPERLQYLRYALRNGYTVQQIARLTHIDPWFLHQLKEIADAQKELENTHAGDHHARAVARSQAHGLQRCAAERHLAFAQLDAPAPSRSTTCGARPGSSPSTSAWTPARPSSRAIRRTCIRPTKTRTRRRRRRRRKCIILGSGPNRIGQGIEFDYCCCHAAFALHDDGYETIMVNCNPETVSTDYDTSDRLYFEPLTFEDVMAIYEHEAADGAEVGVIVQFGGQTPLNLALPLKAAGVKIIGTSPESIDLAEDRKRFGKLLDELDIPQPPGTTATSIEGALEAAERIGYPVLVRPSYVLGGRAMVIAYDAEAVKEYMKQAVEYSQDRPILIDHFLEEATEIDVDALCDGEDVVIGGIMQHIEEAGIHSGDSSCVLPAVDIPAHVLNTIREYTYRLARALNVVGLMNIQYAIQREKVYVIEVNPRASRTVPYVSKATGVPLAKIAARLMTGRRLREFLPEYVELRQPRRVAPI